MGLPLQGMRLVGGHFSRFGGLMGSPTPEGAARRPKTKHGIEVMRLTDGWVRLIRKGTNEDGNPMRVWFDVRVDDLGEVVEIARGWGPSGERRDG